jgi:hypothetical protein
MSESTGYSTKGKITRRYKTDRARDKRINQLFELIRAVKGLQQTKDVRRQLAELRQEGEALTLEHLQAHPEQYTQWPDGEWSLNEQLPKA